MFIFEQPEDPGLQEAIDRILESMKDERPDSDEYAKMVRQLSELYSLKQKPQRVSADTLVSVLANLFGIFVIVGHERAHVVTSKALNYIRTLG